MPGPNPHRFILHRSPLVLYRSELLKWTAKVNLIGPEAKAHLDEHIAEAWPRRRSCSREGEVLDFGSGGGLAGHPDGHRFAGRALPSGRGGPEKMGVFEAHRARVRLELQVYGDRLSRLLPRLPADLRFSLVVSRAVGNPEEWVPSLKEHLEDGARIALFQGTPDAPEIAGFTRGEAVPLPRGDIELPRSADVPRGTSSNMTAKIVTLVNQKGGVGKTTTAINLGASLAACERNVLLVDLDPQANATSGVGIPKNDEKSIYPVLTDGMSIREVIRQTELPNFHVAPSSVDLVAAELELSDAIGREFYLRKALQEVVKDYDYILIDSPPSLGLLTINGLTAAHSVLVPMQCEYFAIEGVAQLLNTIERVRDMLNPGLEIEGIALTMYDERMNLARQVAEEVRSHFGEKVYKTVIPRNVRLGEAPSFGKPIILYDIRSRGSEAYINLAKEFIQRAETVLP